jgi:hypothetical protein
MSFSNKGLAKTTLYCITWIVQAESADIISEEIGLCKRVSVWMLKHARHGEKRKSVLQRCDRVWSTWQSLNGIILNGIILNGIIPENIEFKDILCKIADDTRE